jgi:hypothetical protein
VCRDFIDTLGNTCEVSHQINLVYARTLRGILVYYWFSLWQTGLTSFGTASGLKFLISADSFIHPL